MYSNTFIYISVNIYLHTLSSRYGSPRSIVAGSKHMCLCNFNSYYSTVFIETELIYTAWHCQYLTSLGTPLSMSQAAERYPGLWIFFIFSKTDSQNLISERLGYMPGT